MCETVIVVTDSALVATIRVRHVAFANGRSNGGSGRESCSGFVCIHRHTVYERHGLA